MAGSPCVQPEKEEEKEEEDKQTDSSEDTYSYSEEDSPTTLSKENTRGPKELETQDF